MKKLLTLIITISILASCSKEDINETTAQDCNCVEEIYTNETYICYGSTGLPMLCFNAVVTSSIDVGCQEEFDNLELPDGSIKRVVCNGN